MIYFPVVEEPIQKEENEINASRQKNSERILVVEDSKEQRKLTQRLLEHLGYDIECVENDRACIKYLKSQSVDLVLLDMIMEEDFDGLETYKEIKNIQPELPVIIVSGYSESGRIKEAIDLGVKRHLRKPYKLGTMESIICDVIGG